MDILQRSGLTFKQISVAAAITGYFIVLLILMVGYLTTKGDYENVSEVRNGTQAALGEFPWFVSLREYSDHRPHCGGSIIGREWVLSAEHCVLSEETVIIAGSINVFYETSGTLHNIVSLHSPPETYRDTFYRDIVLIKVAPPFEYRSAKQTYSNAIAPIALAENDSPVTETEGMVAGNGNIDFLSFTKAPGLRIATVKIWNYVYCTERWLKWREEDDGFICIGEGGTNLQHPCKGDSGGPLVVWRNETPVLVGLYSHYDVSMTGCSADIALAGYINISYYWDWLRDTFANNSVVLG